MDTSFYTQTLLCSILLYIAACVFYTWRTIVPKADSRWIAARIFLSAGLLVQTVNWIWRWNFSGQPPYVYLDEMTIFLVWCMVLGYVVFEYTTGHKFPGAVIAALAFLGLGYASMIGSPVPRPLVPALQSYWLKIHVMCYLIGYGFAALGYIVSLFHLSRQPNQNRVFGRIVFALTVGLVTSISVHLAFFSNDDKSVRDLNWYFAALVCAAIYVLISYFMKGRAAVELPEADTMYNLNYHSVAMAYPFLTFGIITGAIWANEAWGRYWGWDPKENWALITWLVYGLYLHLHLNTKWRTAGTVWVSVVGFWALVFTWLGVNYLLSGLHSYA
ncbi:MAG: c-type cytochrome biogenesis protein CcsB [bacterium]